ncbi:hypothetical protein [Estrella lausannensis]|uniref:Putative polymorphic outer membrane protein n=1 Tax=Estrella lausannensis TaxID=483423 RepID=A0A0H5E3C9_9BACT|nr:hypothetical protein [Estrella lausannensis]CRX37725.1 Putative polymorphic outer membrane protein [Estrella lausannensis]
MIKKWIFGLLALVLVAGVVMIAYASDFKVALLRSYASSVMSSSSGGEFTYQKAHFADDGALEVEGLTLGFKSIEEDSGLTLTIAKTRVEMGFSLWPLSVTLQAHLDSPQVSIGTGSSLGRLTEHFKTSASLLTVKAEIDIQKGIIRFDDRGGTVEYGVEGSLKIHDPLRSTLHIQSAADSSSLLVRFNGTDPLEESLAIHCRKAEVCPLFNFLASSLPFIDRIRLSSGTLDGNVLVARGKNGVAAVQGGLSFNEVSFADTEGKFKGRIPHFVFDADFQRKIPRIVIGKGSLKEEAKIEVIPEGREPYFITFQEGSVYVEAVKTIHVQFTGFGLHGNRSLPFEGKGHFNVLHAGSETASVSLQLAYHEHARAALEARLTEMGRGWRSLNMTLSDFTEREFNFLEDAFSSFSPVLPAFNFEKGTFSGKAYAHLLGKVLKEVQVDSIAFQNSSIKFPEHNLIIQSDELLLKVGLNLAAKDPKGSLKADMRIKNGRVEGKDPVDYLATQCDADILVENGALKHLKAEGIIQGVFGRIDFDPANPKGAALAFASPLVNLSEHFPEKFASAIRRNYSDETVYLEAFARQGDENVEFRGVLSVSGKNHEAIASGNFGFKALKSKERPKEEMEEVKRESVSSSSKFDTVVREAASKPFRERLRIEDGWFFFDKMDLSKGIAPFLFIDAEGDPAPLELSGKAIIKGEFDSQGMQIHYDAENIRFEGEDFAIDIDRIYRQDSHKDNLTPANHVFNFEEGTHFGVIPVMQGTYTDKGSGIVFEDVSCQICPRDEKVEVQKIEALSSGILFKGNALVDYSLPGKGVLDIFVGTSAITGRAMDLKNFLSHLQSGSYIAYVPIDGEISSREGDCQFYFKVRPSGTVVDSKINGSLYEGSISLGTSDAVFREIGFSVSYETGGALSVRGLQGTLLVGDPKKPKEYFLSSDGIEIDDVRNGNGKFNVWMEGAGKEVMRLIGTMQGEKRGESLIINILPDKEKSHVLQIAPKRFSLAFLDWDEVARFDLGLSIDLFNSDKSLRETVAKFVASLPAGALKEKSEVSGILEVNLNYELELARFNYEMLFHGLQVGGRSFKEAEISGSYRARTLHLHNFIFDDLSIAAEIAREDVWKIRFLGGGIKDVVAIGLEGAFDPQKGLAGKVRLFEATPKFMSLISNLPESFLADLSGKVKGSGDFYIGKDSEGQPDFTVKLNLQGGLQMGGTRAELQKPLELTYLSREGLLVQGIEAQLVSSTNSRPQGAAFSGKDPIRMTKEGLKIPKLSFTIVPDAFKGVVATIGQAFPELNPSILPDFRGSTSLHGDLFVFNNDERREMSFSLEEGVMLFMGGERPFKQFMVERSDNLLRLSSEFLVGSKWIGVKAQTNDPLRRKGTVELMESVRAAGKDERLSLQWRQDLQGKFEIVKAYGSLSGLDVDLAADEKERGVLHGSVDIDVAEALTLFSKPGEKEPDPLFQHGRGKFSGTIVLSDEQGQAAIARGKIALSSLSVKKILISDIHADVQAGLDGALFSDLVIEDPAGKAEIKQLTASFAEGGTWHTPHITVRGLRPAAIRTLNGEPMVKNKALKINELDVSDVALCPGLPELCQASGWLRFSNISKSLFQNTLFQIPLELVTRLGLNPASLTPVKGEIFFTVADKKIQITKLKDVFSEGKGSKFFLAGESGSYVDFDGNVRMQIRMKQYNILLKFAELFTVTVKGTYSKPVYSLQKQDGAKKKETASR